MHALPQLPLEGITGLKTFRVSNDQTLSYMLKYAYVH